jgi:hypothetical protein
MLYSLGNHVPIPSVKTANARSTGASTTIELRTEVSVAWVLM